ncbi:hypothetical protein EDD18DRAFT_1365423 [Armillaria luteobubalina]|uniref:F-box domain-containing protein n=1 Tax=Armillaria luteobubalina TaxID=153913 RepID=A0AA39P4N7_9AGAR|nr:hypothetical protein EDD18DRAFT_1365423 [Armillaria luteobubalina]
MYLESNDTPHDIDIANISNSLHAIRQSIEQVDGYTKELSRATKSLKMRRAAMLETESKIQAVLSPLRRFSPEIPNEIFQYTVKSGYSTLGTTKGPCSLSHVSRSWRDTALTFSGTLWSNLYISIDRYSCLKNDPLSLLRTCLARSHRHNLSVNFVHSDPAPTFEDKAVEMFRMLIDHCERWRSLEFSNESSAIDGWLNDVHGHLPKLEHLVIHSGLIA